MSKDYLLAVDSQVYGFIILLYSQMVFSHRFNVKPNQEFEIMKPSMDKLYNALSEENRIRCYEEAILYDGFSDLIYTGINDAWKYIYILSNYRVKRIAPIRVDEKHDDDLFYLAVINTNNKAQKSHRTFNSRFV